MEATFSVLPVRRVLFPMQVATYAVAIEYCRVQYRYEYVFTTPVVASVVFVSESEPHMYTSRL